MADDTGRITSGVRRDMENFYFGLRQMQRLLLAECDVYHTLNGVTDVLGHLRYYMQQEMLPADHSSQRLRALYWLLCHAENHLYQTIELDTITDEVNNALVEFLLFLTAELFEVFQEIRRFVSSSEETVTSYDVLSSSLAWFSLFYKYTLENSSVPDEPLARLNFLHSQRNVLSEILSIAHDAEDNDSVVMELGSSEEETEIHMDGLAPFWIEESEPRAFDPFEDMEEINVGMDPVFELLIFEEEEEELTDTNVESIGMDKIEEYTVSYKYRKIRKYGDDAVEKCMVCLLDFEEDANVRRLRCMHLFHTDCSDRWLQRDRRCPLCRIGINEVSDNFPLHSDGCATDV